MWAWKISSAGLHAAELSVCNPVLEERHRNRCMLCGVALTYSGDDDQRVF